ncbi:MAG: histidinol phosphate phosphatase domain-containing protein [Chloroflexi bacterium]|nr:histidinol phosphate phosphatase domain-containing protein [Chloroflexota bacterium]
MFDFQTQTFLSDGVLSPAELARRAKVNGYTALAITDHVGLTDQDRVLETLVRECAALTQTLNMLVIPGVELTHVAKDSIDAAARRAKKMGAALVLVHGETIVEPVEKGTNLAALMSDYVDILAHPGLISQQLVKLAAQRGKFLELSARRGHSLTNGHIANLARESKALLLLNSDAHGPEDLLTPSLAKAIAHGAGLTVAEARQVLKHNPQTLLARLNLPGPHHKSA